MQIRNSKLKFFLVCAVFIVPFIGAIVLFKMKPNLSKVNHGKLLKPTISLADFAEFSTKPHQWYLVHVFNRKTNCDVDCNEDIVTTRQVRIAMSTDYMRLHRVLLTKNRFQMNEKEQPDLIQLALKSGHDDLAEGLYLADSHGQLILFYGKHLKPKPIYQDLKRLLHYG